MPSAYVIQREAMPLRENPPSPPDPYEDSDTAPAPVPPGVQRTLRPGLDAWLERARAAGLSEEAVWSLIDSAVLDAYGEDVA